jgi:hypothetical protein
MTKDRDNNPAAGKDIWSVNDVMEFTVLYQEDSHFRRKAVRGTILSAKKEDLVLTTGIPLEAGQLVEWDDRHKKGNLHFALVKGCTGHQKSYEVSLKLL